MIRMLGVLADTRIECARISVVNGVERVGNTHDIAFPIANVALAITNGLSSHDSAHWGKHDVATTVRTDKRLAFAARAAIGIRRALHATRGARRTACISGTSRTTSAVVADLDGACGNRGEREEKNGNDDFGQKS